MSYLDSNSIWFCDVCGAMVWHSRITMHQAWHAQAFDENDGTVSYPSLGGVPEEGTDG